MKTCKKCQIQKTLSEFRIRKTLGIYYTVCRECQYAQHREWEKANPEYVKQKCAKYYQKTRTASRVNVLNRTPEERRERATLKANLRATRAKQARFNDELSTLVFAEAHSLRKLRNEITGIEWHVDHIVPLKGRKVSGLHIWSNLQVIPKIQNLKKGNTHALDD